MANETLNGLKVAVLMTEGFEQVEMTEPRKALDLATLASALNRDNPKRGNAAVATALIVRITLLDLLPYSGVKATHRREPGSERAYSDRSSLPRGPQTSRGLVRKDFDQPSDYRAEGRVADALPGLVA